MNTFEYALLIEKLECIEATGEGVGSSHDEIYLHIYVNDEFHSEWFKHDTIDMDDGDDDLRYVDVNIRVQYRDEIEVKLFEQDDEDDASKDEYVGSVFISREDEIEGSKKTSGEDGLYRVYWRMIDKPIPTLRILGIACQKSSCNCNRETVDAIAEVASDAAKAASKVIGKVKTPETVMMSKAFKAASRVIENVALAVEWLMNVIEGDDDVYLQHVPSGEGQISEGGPFCPPNAAEHDERIGMDDGDEVDFLDEYDEYFRFPLDRGPVTIQLREGDAIKYDVCLGALTITEEDYEKLIDEGAQVAVACEYLDNRSGEGAVYHICYSVALEDWTQEPNQENQYGAPTEMPFEADLQLVEAKLADQWANHILETVDSSFSQDRGHFYYDIQCADSRNEGTSLTSTQTVAFQGRFLYPIYRFSYIALSGSGANKVDVCLYTPDTGEVLYQGWNGLSWVDSPAVKTEDGYYWYRLLVNSSYCSYNYYTYFYAKTLRAGNYSEPFRLWAYWDKSAVGPTPTPPVDTNFDTDLDLVTAESSDEWCRDVLGLENASFRKGGESYKYDEGRFNADWQCAESFSAGSRAYYIIIEGDRVPYAVDMVSYIALAGDGADTVGIYLSPSNGDGQTWYEGWDGRNWVEGSATAVEVDGFYWYRLHITWPNGVDSYRMELYTYPEDRVSHKPFRMWAFRDQSPSSSLLPFEANLEIVTGESGEEWADNVFGIPDSTISYGTFNPNLQCMKSEFDGLQWIFTEADLLSPIDVVSYVALKGEGDPMADVYIYSPSKSRQDYQGWDGNSWVNGPAVNVNGYYWYRLHVQDSPSDSSVTFQFYAINTQSEGTDNTFRLWAFREK